MNELLPRLIFSFILITVSLTKFNFDDRPNSVWNFFVKQNALLSIFYSSSFVASGSWVESLDSTRSSIKSSILANSFSRTLSTYNTLRKLIGLFSRLNFRHKMISNCDSADSGTRLGSHIYLLHSPFHIPQLQSVHGTRSSPFHDDIFSSALQYNTESI